MYSTHLPFFLCFISLIIIYFQLKFQNILQIHKQAFPNHSYNIFLIENFLSQSECDIIINKASKHLRRSRIMSDDDTVSNVRTSRNMFLHNHMLETKEELDLIHKIELFTQKVSNLPKENQEPLQVCKYETSQYYKPHYDCCFPKESKACIDDYKWGGFRYLTFLIYLNNVDDGGETEFPLLNFKIKPKLGNGIVFFNTLPSKTGYHPISKHAALPVTKGTKWICNKWVRCSKYILH